MLANSEKKLALLLRDKLHRGRQSCAKPRVISSSAKFAYVIGKFPSADRGRLANSAAEGLIQGLVRQPHQLRNRRSRPEPVFCGERWIAARQQLQTLPRLAICPASRLESSETQRGLRMKGDLHSKFALRPATILILISSSRVATREIDSVMRLLGAPIWRAHTNVRSPIEIL